MSQKASHYLSTGIKESKRVLSRGKKSFFKYFIYSISSIIGKLFFLSFPMFALADYHIADQIKVKKHFRLDEALEDSGKRHKYWATMQFALLYQTLLVTGLVLLGGLAYGLIQLGFAIDGYILLGSYYAVFAFEVISGTMIALYIFLLGLYLGPIVYLIQSNDDVDLVEALKQSALIMTDEGRLKLFYIKLTYSLRFLIIGLISVTIGYVSFDLLTIGWFIMITIILSVLLLISIAKVMLAYKISSSLLFDDLSKDSAFESLNGQNNHKIFVNKLSKEEILMTLFDEIEADDEVDVAHNSIEADEELDEEQEAEEDQEIEDIEEAEDDQEIEDDQENEEDEEPKETIKLKIIKIFKKLRKDR